ncbi:arsenic resistance protein, partial [Bacteroides sp.]|uniref:arsenic resistance protein n=1 Tax=Bacteroides sp. TaxID=29523 RepID=UPI003AF1D002
MEKKQGIGFFEKYLTIWVALCIIIGIAVGQWLPAIPQTLSKFEYANVSIPVAILIWLMIYPMMLKVDFQSVKNVGKRPKGIIVTCVTNWLIKPFTMFGIAYLFFYVVFKAFWKIQCKLPPKTKRFYPLKTFNNAPLKSLDRWGYYYFSLFPSVCSHFT